MDSNGSFDLADVAAVTKGNNGFGGDNAVLWFVLLLFMMGGAGGFGAGRGPAAPQGVTEAQLTAGLNNSQTQAQLQQIALSSANNNYETAQLVNNQTNALLQQRYADQINMVQGFNQMNLAVMNQTNTLGSKLDALGMQMDQCCCSIKTQMLQDKYERAQSELTQARNAISNYNQSQYLLGQMGRYVAWEPSGTATSATTAVVQG